MPCTVEPENPGNRMLTCFTCGNFSTCDRRAPKLHVRSHKTTYRCEYCPRFVSEKRAKVIEHEKNKHADLLNLNTGVNINASSSNEISQAVDQFFPDSLLQSSTSAEVPETAPVYAATPDVSEMASVSVTTQDQSYMYSASTYATPASTATSCTTAVPAGAPIPATLRDMPKSKTFMGDQVASTRVAASRDPNLMRMWEDPSLMVGGITYRKVTERVTLSDGTSYESVVEEMEKPVQPEEEADSRSKRHKSHKRRR